MSDVSKSAPVVLATSPINESWMERLRAVSPDLRIEQRPRARSGDISDELWREIDIVLTYNTLPAPGQAPRLRWVQLHSAGANHILQSPLLDQSVTFTTASGVHAVNIAEYVQATMLAWFHRVEQMFAWKQRGIWPTGKDKLFAPEELRGKTIGVVGYGSIGREVARLAAAFGMRVLAMLRSADRRDHGFIFPGVGDPEGTIPERYYQPEDLHAMLAECDVVVIGLPLSTQTTHFINEAALRAMKKTAFLVNIARGDVCDEEALIQALRENWISGAALDVFHREPLPDDSPFYQLSNVILSPHISGATPAYNDRLLMIFEANLRRFLRGEPLYNAVDPARGY